MIKTTVATKATLANPLLVPSFRIVTALIEHPRVLGISLHFIPYPGSASHCFVTRSGWAKTAQQ